MKILLLILGLSCASHAGLKAPHPHPILEKEKKCKNKDTTNEIMQCWIEIAQSWDKELNTVYKRLLKSIEKKAVKDALIKAQQQWVHFRDQELKFYASYYDRDGTIWRTILPEMRSTLTQNRVQQLYRILESVDMSGDSSENYLF